MIYNAFQIHKLGDMMEENVTREEILDWYAKGGRNYRLC